MIVPRNDATDWFAGHEAVRRCCRDRLADRQAFASRRVVELDPCGLDRVDLADRTPVVSRRRSARPAEEDIFKRLLLLRVRPVVDIQAHVPVVHTVPFQQAEVTTLDLYPFLGPDRS